MFCSQCGKQIPENSNFCTGCGAKVKTHNLQEPGISKDVEPEVMPVTESELDNDEPQIKKEETISNINPENADQNLQETPVTVQYNVPDNVNHVIPETTIHKDLNTDKKIKEGKKWLIPVFILLLLAVIGTGCFLLFQVFGDKKSKNDNGTEVAAVATTEVTQKVTKEPTEVPVELSLSFSQTEVKLGIDEILDLNTILICNNIDKADLIWESDNPNQIRVDTEGKISANGPGAAATIKVTYRKDKNISATCTASSMSEADVFAKQLTVLNSDSSALESIDVFADQYVPGNRNNNPWNGNLFYSLEEIDPDNMNDGQINSYNIEKKQLINEASGNKMEYEIYRNPDTNLVNKIVSIEYAGNYLNLTDYYYGDDGKVSFIFTRKDFNYIPSYANPTKDGQRYYFDKDCMVKWRIVKEGKQSNYILNKKEKERGGNEGKVVLYNNLTTEQKNNYDQKEKDMINAAYNTYNIVLNAKGINNIVGFVADENGNPLPGAKVSLYSDKYNSCVYEMMTDETGRYLIIVPSEEAQYSITVEAEGYVATSLYNIKLSNQLVEAFLETAILIKSTGSSYEIQLALRDALNYAPDSNEMMPLNNAQINIRLGINNRTGDILLSNAADEYGHVYVTLKEGVYTVEINKSGYETSYRTIVSKKDNNFVQINTSPVLREDEVRIVLTWGDIPADLDSHLFTPNDSTSGDNTYHIWFNHKSDQNNNDLDVDDTTSYGPETMTINHLGNGLYKYYVADYTECCYGDTNSSLMSESGARVDVYTKDGLVQSFNVPDNRPGVIWEVFEIRNKRIIPIQRYYTNIADKTWWNNEK